MSELETNSYENYLHVLAQRINAGEIDFTEARRMADNYQAWHSPETFYERDPA